MSVVPGRRALQQEAARQPKDPAIHERLARTLLAEQDLAALSALQALLDDRFADRPFTHLVAGHASKARGDVEAAAQRYRRALAVQPNSGEALYNLVDLDGGRVNEAESRHIAELTGHEELPAADRINIRFARARLLEQSGDADAALAHYRAANDLARTTLAEHGIRYDADTAERQLEADLANWQPTVFEASLPPSGIDLTPVFVIGLPRSGTTLVEQILASHPLVAAGGELTLGPEVEHACRQRLGLGPGDPLPLPADSRLREELERARERYLDGLFERGLDARWVVDKLPANSRIAGFLRLLFPDAPMVHCRRDPRALAWSLYTANFAAHEAWYHDLDAMVGVFRRHDRLLAHWRVVLPPLFTEISYEDLVRAPEARIPELLAACEIPFDPATLKPEALERPVFTASHAQVRQAIHTNAIERWRPYASHLRRFEPN
ncbi:sulfotransferase [Haliea sp. E1-2-M8]|uniref:tetratricopeptide repeat-containing sulfotransferase family protein n=1 Tax=Haliea sp. E1-2-M8 TaxID=3064706 RepID=UPI00271C1FD8|nr:tetratricopeptide repeat-containing sulfotransferase family protein [Haliea sp. E1-2-M8]MDO8861720.1 sulfotransferase [Haliea sp. E1-2-M8]